MHVSVSSATPSIIRSHLTSSASGTSTWRTRARRCSLSSWEVKVIWPRTELSLQSSHRTSRKACQTASLQSRLLRTRTSLQLTNYSHRSVEKSSRVSITLRSDVSMWPKLSGHLFTNSSSSNSTPSQISSSTSIYCLLYTSPSPRDS